jgi:hypothetical protein
MDWSSKLRSELNALANAWAGRAGLLSYNSNGNPGVVIFEATSDGLQHGNFLDSSWTAIKANPSWLERLTKAHSQKSALPLAKQAAACELDSSNSSDAILMNCFCFPNGSAIIFSGLGLPWNGSRLIFGYKPQLPLVNGGVDKKTEIDLWTGDVIIEAKLTEASFTEQSRAIVNGYKDFASIFAVQYLPQDAIRYGGYQLIRNVLAAHYMGVSFVVILDARRPDLMQEWWRVHGALDPALRARCGFRTWQQVAKAAPAPLRGFLEEKYGL